MVASGGMGCHYGFIWCFCWLWSWSSRSVIGFSIALRMISCRVSVRFEMVYGCELLFFWYFNNDRESWLDNGSST